jgi:hypothetical protein
MPNWSGGAEGAAGGAATGASIAGPYGAVIGGVAGGLLGMFGGSDSDQNKQELEQYRQMMLNRQAPQMGAAAQASTSDFRSNQQELINRLNGIATGQAPSLAQAQLNEATDKNMASQQSIAASGRGNPALASMVAANNMQNLGQNAAQQSVGARIQEEQMANQLMGSNVQAARAADEQTSQFNAQQQNYAAEANLTAKLKSMGLNDDAILNALGQYRQAAAMPTLGNQLMAGGAGALGMYLGNKYSRTAPGSSPAMTSLAQQYPTGSSAPGYGPVTSPDQLG